MNDVDYGLATNSGTIQVHLPSFLIDALRNSRPEDWLNHDQAFLNAGVAVWVAKAIREQDDD